MLNITESQLTISQIRAYAYYNQIWMDRYCKMILAQANKMAKGKPYLSKEEVAAKIDAALVAEVNSTAFVMSI